MNRKNWFLDNDDEEKISTDQKKRKKGFQKAGRVATSTVVFIPNTRAGLLLRKMRESEERLSKVRGFRKEIVSALTLERAVTVGGFLARPVTVMVMREETVNQGT